MNQNTRERTVVDAIDGLTEVMDGVFVCVSEIADTLNERKQEKPAGAPNTDGLTAEQVQPDSAPSVPQNTGDRQALVDSINRMLALADCRKLSDIYHFVLNIV